LQEEHVGLFHNMAILKECQGLSDMKFIDNGQGDGGSQDMVQNSGESAKED